MAQQFLELSFISDDFGNEALFNKDPNFSFDSTKMGPDFDINSFIAGVQYGLEAARRGFTNFAISDVTYEKAH